MVNSEAVIIVTLWRKYEESHKICKVREIVQSLHFLYMVKGSLARKLPSYGQWSWSAFTPSCQPHRRVNPFYRYCGFWRGRSRGSCRQKVHETIARAWFALQNVKNHGVRSTFRRWGQKNVHETVASSVSQKDRPKNEGIGALWEHEVGKNLHETIDYSESSIWASKSLICTSKC